MDLMKIREITQKIMQLLQDSKVNAQEWEKIEMFVEHEYNSVKLKSTLPQRDKDTFQELLKTIR